MYFCPLCVGDQNGQGFGSLDALKAHLDLFHCNITNSVQNRPSVLYELENRIENLIDSNLPNQHASSNRRIPGIHEKQGPLQNYALDYDYANAENEYLKRKFNDEFKKWKRDIEQEREKYESLEKQFRSVRNLLSDASKKQRDGKRRLESFVDNLCNDLEHLEDQLEGDPQNHRDHAKPLFINTTDPRTYGAHSMHEFSQPDMIAQFDQNQRSRLAWSSGRTTAGLDSGFDDLDMDRKSRSISAPSRQSRLHEHRPKTTISMDTVTAPTHAYASPIYEPALVSYFDEADLGFQDDLAQKISHDFDEYDTGLMLVFRNLDAFDLLRCALVSRKWHDIARHPMAWRTVRLKNQAIDLNVLKSISIWCSQTVKLTLENLKIRNSVQEIGALENGLEEILRTCNGHLTFLKIVSCSPVITDRALWLAACYCKNLQKLVYISDQFPANAPCLWALGASCRLLDTLIVPPLTSDRLIRGLQFDDEALLMMARCFPTTLKVLCIGGKSITLVGLKYIAKSCQWLEALELDHCVGLFSLRSAKSMCNEGLKNLHTLNFTHCNLSPGMLKYFNDRLPNIRTIRVVFSWRDFQTPKYLELFLSECQILMNKDPSFKKTLKLEEHI